MVTAKYNIAKISITIPMYGLRLHVLVCERVGSIGIA